MTDSKKPLFPAFIEIMDDPNDGVSEEQKQELKEYFGDANRRFIQHAFAQMMRAELLPGLEEKSKNNFGLDEPELRATLQVVLMKLEKQGTDVSEIYKLLPEDAPLDMNVVFSRVVADLESDGPLAHTIMYVLVELGKLFGALPLSFDWDNPDWEVFDAFTELSGQVAN